MLRSTVLAQVPPLARSGANGALGGGGGGRGGVWVCVGGGVWDLTRFPGAESRGGELGTPPFVPPPAIVHRSTRGGGGLVGRRCARRSSGEGEGEGGCLFVFFWKMKGERGCTTAHVPCVVEC